MSVPVAQCAAQRPKRDGDGRRSATSWRGIRAICGHHGAFRAMRNVRQERNLGWDSAAASILPYSRGLPGKTAAPSASRYAGLLNLRASARPYDSPRTPLPPNLVPERESARTHSTTFCPALISRSTMRSGPDDRKRPRRSGLNSFVPIRATIIVVMIGVSDRRHDGQDALRSRYAAGS